MEGMKREYIMNFAKKKTITIAAAAVLAVGFVLPFWGCAKKENASGTTHSGVIISEVISSNKYTLTASDGSTPDIVELYNFSDKDIDLEGCGLSDNAGEPFRFKFPGTVLPAGGYLTVYCTGAEDTANADGIYRTGFKISSSGETLSFTDAEGNALSVVTVPELAADISYAWDGQKYAYFAHPTPGAANSGESNDTGIFEYAQETVSASLSINEFMSSSEMSVQDASGERCGWVEIKNTGSESVNLKGYGLTDDETRPKKWSFPEKELAPGEIVLVFLSGKGSSENGEIHASFGLSDEDAALFITNEAGKTVDSVPNVSAGGMISAGRDASGNTAFFPVPTPGEENGEGFASAEEAEKQLPEVYISEIKSTSEDKIDWIELCNRTGEDISLAGWGVSDTLKNVYRYKFEDAVIKAGGYLVIEGKGGSGSYTAEFGIKKAGESVYLTNEKGVTVDSLNGGWQSGDISRGRTGQDSTPYYFEASTKGAANSASVYTSYASDPVFSVQGGYVSSGTSLELSAKDGETIYYTTDGSEPTKNSNVYSGPISISKSCAVRAVAYADGKLRSAVVTENYLTGEKHTIPVVCVSLSPYDFSSNEAGIYAKGPGWVDTGEYTHQGANYWKDWEKKMNFEYFEADGTKGVSFDAGIKIFGQYSRELAQKSFAVHLRGKYGLNEVTYPFFRDSDITTFSSFILRQSGQDWDETHLLDAFIHQSIKGEMSLDMMDYRPVALYINGEYWGLYNIREKENADYVANHYGADKTQVNVVKGDRNVQAGSVEGWTNVRNYILDHIKMGDYNTSGAADWMNEHVDMVSQMEWTMTEAFFYNSDTGNVRDYQIEGGKWKKMLFDMDHALKYDGYKYINYLADVMNDDGHGTANMFQSHIFKGIKYNDIFKKQFIELYAQHLNSTFTVERLCAIVDAMAEEIRPEMARQCARWSAPGSMDEWEKHISNLKETIEKRRPVAINELKSLFSISDDRMAELFPNG